MTRMREVFTVLPLVRATIYLVLIVPWIYLFSPAVTSLKHKHECAEFNLRAARITLGYYYFYLIFLAVVEIISCAIS